MTIFIARLEFRLGQPTPPPLSTPSIPSHTITLAPYKTFYWTGLFNNEYYKTVLNDVGFKGIGIKKQTEFLKTVSKWPSRAEEEAVQVTKLHFNLLCGSSVFLISQAVRGLWLLCREKENTFSRINGPQKINLRQTNCRRVDYYAFIEGLPFHVFHFGSLFCVWFLMGVHAYLLQDPL